MAKESGISPLSVSLPQGGGDVRGLGGGFVPDYNRGTGSFRLDLQVPPGHAGFAPPLSLEYSSGASNGAFGLGWTISMPTIRRSGEKGFVGYDASDIFVLDGHGELVRLPDGSYRPKVDGLFARIRRLDEGSWEVRHRDGVVHRYGTSGGARLSDPADDGRVLAWALEEAEDLHGNLIRCAYLRDGNNLYLSEITYAIYGVRFHYEERPDVYGSGRFGFPVETRLRCRAIELHCDRLAPNTLIRRHGLAYTSPPETPLSLLHRITYSGHRWVAGNEQVKDLRPLTFSYSQFRPDRCRLTSFTSTVGSPPPPLGEQGVELVDFTGDGMPDVVQVDGLRSRYWRNRGDGSWDPPRALREIPAGVRLAAPGVTLGDMDGNGTADLLVTGGLRTGYYPGLGRAAWDRFHPYHHSPAFRLGDGDTRQLDLDADGVVDVLRSGPRGFVLHLNEGDADWSRPTYTPRRSDLGLFPDVSLSDPHVHLADMTGDGLTDIVLVHSGRVWYWPYQGIGKWGARRSVESPPTFPRHSDPTRVFLSDVNGDGIDDLIYVDGDSVVVWINQFGTRFAPPVKIPHTPLASSTHVRLADMTGNGTRGVLWSLPLRGDRRRYRYLDLSGGEKPYLLTGIDDGLGKQTEIRYSTSTNFAVRDRNDGHPWPTFLPMPVQVVAGLTQRDLHAGFETATDIRYHDGLYDGNERRFVGFGTVEILESGDATVPGLLTVLHFDQTPSEGLPPADRAVATARWGKLLETTQQEAGQPSVVRRAVSTWVARVEASGADGSPVVVVHREHQRSEVYGGDEGPLVVRHDFEFDERGHVVRDRYEANGSVPLVKISEISYVKGPGGETLSAPARVLDRREDGTLVREVRTYYDGEPFVGLPLGTATRGDRARVSVRVLSSPDFDAHYGPEGYIPEALGYRREDGVVWADAGRYKHDGRGTLVAARNALGHESTFAYDQDGLFPQVARNPLGHELRFGWDDAALQPAEIHDPSGGVRRFGFDPLGRVTAEAIPGDTLDNPSRSVSYHLEASPPFADMEQTLSSDGSLRSHHRVLHTGGGEVLQTRTRVDPGTVVVSPVRRYNARGWLAQKGEPSFSDTMAYGPGPDALVASYLYDALGQVRGVVYPDGHRDRTVYEPFRTVHYDANDTDASAAASGFFNSPTIYRSDGWGRIVAVVELHDGLITRHTYAYDDRGNLTEARGPDEELILRQSYDLSGNRLRLSHRDAGDRTYYWDAAGQLRRVVDAAGNRIDREFDVLGRPRRTHVGGQEVHVLTYDDSARPNQIGRLSEVDDEAGAWAYDYDVRGQLTGLTLHADGRSWRLEHERGPTGLTERIRYPDGAKVSYTYNSAGHVTGVPGYVDEARYDTRGRRMFSRHANGVQTSVDYEPTTGFLHRLRVLGPGDEVLEDRTYERDNVGNLMGLVDGRPPAQDAPHHRKFTLDARYRLVRVDGGGPPGGVPGYSLVYGYDDAGNFTRLPSDAHDLWYDPPGSNRIAGRVVGATNERLYDHDPNGNLRGMPGRKLRFDPLGRLVEVRRTDGRWVRYRYNAAGERIWRETGDGASTSRSLFLSGLYEEHDDGSWCRYVHDSGRPIALESPAGRRYLHGDDLGHVTLLTDQAGLVIGRRHYHPFGEFHLGAGAGEPRGFAGKTLDELTGLYYFGARYYAPELGRFVTPDPLLLRDPVQAVTNPQLHNLYVYANNNPMNYIDPSGLSLFGVVLGGLAGALVGSFVFIVSGGNPFLAGLAGGLAGGAVSGAIDGGTRGAIAGACIGAVTGALGGGAMWGLSALGGLIGGHAGQAATVWMASTMSLMPSVVYMAETNNWEYIVFGTLAGLAGSYAGRALGNYVMMRGVWDNLSTSPRVQAIANKAQAVVGDSADFGQGAYAYNVENNPGGRYGCAGNSTVTLNKATLGNNYLEFRRTMSHELYHILQEQQTTDPDLLKAHYMAAGQEGYLNNPFEIAARDFAVRANNYYPYPFYAEPSFFRFDVYSHITTPALVGFSSASASDGP